MYPIHLEKQYENLWQREFSSNAKKINQLVLKKLKEYLAEKEKTIPDSVSRSDSDGHGLVTEIVTRFDASELLQYIQSLRNEYGSTMASPEFRSKMERQLNLISHWSADKIKESLQKQNDKMNGPPSPGKPQPNHSSYRIPAIPLPKNNNIIWDNLQSTLKTNSQLGSDIFHEHFDTIRYTVSSGLAKGESYATIAQNLQNATGVSANKAAFWARDQASKFFGQQSKLQQSQAGIPGYIWRTMRDSKVRDAHRGKAYGGPADQYWSWKSPPTIHRKNGDIAHLHPGEDWNCRCYPEPSYGPESESRKPEPDQSGPSQSERENQAIQNQLRMVFANTKAKSISGRAVIPSSGMDRNLKRVNQQLQTMSRAGRVQMVNECSNAIWDESNVENHSVDRVREKQFQDLFGASPKDVAEFVLKNRKYDQVLMRNLNTLTITFIHHGKKLVIPVARDSLKIKSCFLADDDQYLRLLAKKSIEIQ